jgi:metal-dependent amidase/aminoacylase/carboxypeptidase family protein
MASEQAIFKKAEAEIDGDSQRLTEYKTPTRIQNSAFMETRIAGIVVKELKDLGFEVRTGIGKTGVVGILRNGPRPTVMYRADMDANAVEEIRGLPYASKVRVKREDGSETPVGHMCGHDTHVTCTLGMRKPWQA